VCVCVCVCVQAGEHGSVERIADFVRQELQLGDKIFTLIHEEKIDAPVVLACSKEELTSLGVRKLGDQKRLTMFARAALAKDAAIDERRRDILEAGAFAPLKAPRFSILVLRLALLWHWWVGRVNGEKAPNIVACFATRPWFLSPQASIAFQSRQDAIRRPRFQAWHRIA